MKKRIFLTALALVMVVALIGGAVGCAKPAPAAEAIVLGCPLSIAYQHSWTADRAIRLAVEEINAEGGVNVGGVMRPFKLVTIETREEEPGVPVSECLLGFEKLILDEKVDVLCGGSTMSEASLALIDLVNKYNMVHITCMGTWTPGWPAKVGGDIEKYGCSFKMSADARDQVGLLVDLLEEMRKEYGWSTAYCIITDVLFCRNSMDAFAGLAEKKGWEILGKDLCPQGTTDYSPALLKAKASGADVLLIWTNDVTATILIRQFMDLEVPALPVGFAPAAQEHEIYEALGGKCGYFIFPCGHAAVTSTKMPGAVEFQQAYEKMHGRRPFGGAGAAYEGLYVLKDAIERAGSLETDALIAALEQTDYMGTSGRIRFDENHMAPFSYDPEEGVVGNLSQWIGGERVCVWPPSIADSEVLLPPWMK